MSLKIYRVIYGDWCHGQIKTSPQLAHTSHFMFRNHYTNSCTQILWHDMLAKTRWRPLSLYHHQTILVLIRWFRCNLLKWFFYPRCECCWCMRYLNLVIYLGEYRGSPSKYTSASYGEWTTCTVCNSWIRAASLMSRYGLMTESPTQQPNRSIISLISR